MPDWGGVSKASILKIGDFFHMWFSYRKMSDYRYNKKILQNWLCKIKRWLSMEIRRYNF